MKNIYKSILALFACAVFFSATFSYANAQITGAINIQTNSATNISYNQATLNGYFSVPYITGSNYVWFQYGIDTNYGNQTSQQSMGSGGGYFNQVIYNLLPNNTYHFRAIFQGNNGTSYGQDTTFYTSNNGNNGYYYGNASLNITKQIINLTQGNLNWQTAVNANPGDVLSFAITIQAGNQDLHNVYVKDNIPAGLIYRGNLLVNSTMNYSGGDPASGIYVGTIPANNIEVISYQAQVNTTNLNYSTTLTNNATVTSQETGTQTASAQILMNPVNYQNPTSISTGLTNDPIKDSFFLPLLLIALGSWFYFSGNVYRFADWLGEKIN